MDTRTKWRLAVLVYLFGSSVAADSGNGIMQVATGLALLALLALPLWDERLLAAQTNQ